MLAARARVVQFEAGGKLDIPRRARDMASLACPLGASLARAAWLGIWKQAACAPALQEASVKIQGMRRNDNDPN
eukprot:6196982-Pyramimonas_sp.AAC.1